LTILKDSESNRKGNKRSKESGGEEGDDDEEEEEEESGCDGGEEKALRSSAVNEAMWRYQRDKWGWEEE